MRFFCGGFPARLEHAADARRVDGERLLHEHVAALLDGVLEMDRPEGGRRGEEDNAAGGQCIDRLPVGVQTEELAFRRHVDLLVELLGEVLEAAVEPMFEHIGHGHKLGWALGRQGIGGGPGAAAAAADQGHVDRIVLAGVAPRRQRAGQRRTGQTAAGALEKLTS